MGDWSKCVWEEGRVAGEAREVASVAGMRVRWIPAGTFWMGAGEDEKTRYHDRDEKPRREVTLTRGFWMMETPVTQGQYTAVIGENPSHYKEAGLDAPVERVSWHDAAAFANKLSLLEELSPCFVRSEDNMDGVGNKASDYVGGKGWRLPTEAEWEYAARAGTTTQRYENLTKIAWYSENSNGKTHSVGQKQANAWGLRDTLGNVWEWCYDWYEYNAYTLEQTVDPVYAVKTSDRVRRGGCLDDLSMDLRVANRDWYLPIAAYKNIGFRLVRCS
ncbi:formylglycine-generating enzyme family protein [Myxococcota bacterium]|nr:formylglycine-generating enzyme family protein [Myxococcota bacterium]